MFSELVRKYWRLAAAVAVTIVFFALLYIWRDILLPFIIGLILAYLLYPLIKWLERHLPRRWGQGRTVFSIIVVSLVVLGLFGFLLSLAITAAISASASFIADLPTYLEQATEYVQEWFRALEAQIPPQFQEYFQQFVEDFQSNIGSTITATLSRVLSTITGSLTLVLGFVSLPIFYFYVLKDSDKLRTGLHSLTPPWAMEHIRNIGMILEGVLGRYIRSVIVLGITVGFLCLVGLLAMRIPYAAALAFFAAFTELIPTIGPWIGGAAGVLVTWAAAPEKIIWVIALYVGIQLLENIFLAPRIQGQFMHINPALILVLLALGAYLAGFWGMLLIVPVTATIVEIYRYVLKVTQDQNDNKEEEKVE